MKLQVPGAKAGFICRSLLWSLLLYGCFLGACHRQAVERLFNNDEQPVAHTATSSGNMPQVRISIDSMQRGIRIAGGVLQQVSAYIRKY